MSLTQEIENALTNAGLDPANYVLTPDQYGGVDVQSATNDYDQVESAREPLEAAFPYTDYTVAFARSITDPKIYVRKH